MGRAKSCLSVHVQTLKSASASGVVELLVTIVVPGDTLQVLFVFVPGIVFVLSPHTYIVKIGISLSPHTTL